MEEHRKTVTKLAEKGVVVMRASNNKPTLGIIDSIKELQEMEDEPDNEQCPPSFDEDSIGRKPEHLNCSEEDASDRNLLSALQESNKPGDHDSFLEIGNRNTPQLSTHSTYKYIVNEHTTFEDLKEANSKLLKDNQKMFRECMRLRKIVGA